mgnify:CR=1 FL=1
MNRCLACDGPAPHTWFCRCCMDAKEAGYAEARRLEITNYGEVIRLRETFLHQHKLDKHTDPKE